MCVPLEPLSTTSPSVLRLSVAPEFAPLNSNAPAATLATEIPHVSPHFRSLHVPSNIHTPPPNWEQKVSSLVWYRDYSLAPNLAVCRWGGLLAALASLRLEICSSRFPRRRALTSCSGRRSTQTESTVGRCAFARILGLYNACGSACDARHRDPSASCPPNWRRV